MMNSCKFVCAIFGLTLLIQLSQGSKEEGPVVEIGPGKFQGTVQKSRDGREFLSFLQVPYGTAKRFQNPVLLEGPGSGTDRTRWPVGSKCAQKFWYSHTTAGIEDCLTINIHTPDVKGNYPVMVWFHGGGMTLGTGNFHGARYMLDENVVLVTVNYRLGPFGFLSTGDSVISGNFGLKDQSLALLWTQKFISNFGGNPDSVTIFGLSAGGASVCYNVLSPLSKGLFHAAISHSGTALDPWAFTDDKRPKFMREKFGKLLDCPTDCSKKLRECLETKSTQEILDATKHLDEWSYDPFTPFGAVVEPSGTPGAFLTESPEILLQNGNFNRVPWVMGVTEDEGILMHSAFILHHQHLADDLKVNWRKILPITLEYNEAYGNLSEARQLEASELIHKFYFEQNKVKIGEEESRQALTNMFGDRFFNHGLVKNAILASKYTPVYPYIFALDRGSDYDILEFLGIKGKNFGVTHADDMSYLFSEVFDIAPDFQKDSVGEKMSKLFIKMWVSIARDKKPTFMWPDMKSWKSISKEETEGTEPLKYFRIDEKTSEIVDPFKGRLKFWDDLEKNILNEQNEGQKKDEL